ncbi:13482_t:CDS:2 [Gigaspora margarita]|uniref:13482_t:CDS:1 n=1 Tax=Gigaspora margarita TaxID=4874 RepID=A0ABM8W2P6_GIGMA|nr:13482_t:CDS:2 [Gigaspora margarita]
MTTLSCEINKVPVTAILDSGANCNIIAEEIVNKLDLKINNISDIEIYIPIGKLDVVGVIHEISISILSQGPKWKQVKVTDIFVVSIPEHQSIAKQWPRGPQDRLSEYGVNYIVNNIKTSEAWLWFAKYYPPKYIHKHLLKLGYEINSRDYWENCVFHIKNNLTSHKQIEQILYFLEIDRSLYPALFVNRLWYKCSIPLLWKRVELKGNDIHYGHYFPVEYNYCEQYRTWLESFIKLICEEKKPVYASNLKSLKISHYHSITHKLIRSIINYCQNIIHLDFKKCVGISNEILIKIASSYTNLKHFNLWDNQIITDKGLYKIMQMCNKLEYLNISYCRGIPDKSLIAIAESCRNLKKFYFSEAFWITDKTISRILNLCINLQSLDIAFSCGEIKDANMLIQAYLKIEYLDFASVIAFQNNSLIVAIIRSSPNLKHFNISGNDIRDEVVEAIASTCYELEYLDLGGCGFITEPSISHSCLNLKYLNLEGCENISEKIIKQLNPSIYIENYNSSYEQSDFGSSDTFGSDPDDNIQSKNTHSLIPDPLRVSQSIIFTGRPNRMVSTNTLNVTDLISAIRFYYKEKWRSLNDTEIINFQIRKNPSFNLVLGQEWLYMRKAKIIFGFSSRTYEQRDKIVIDGISIPLIEKDFNKASSTKNDPYKSDLLEEEITNIIKKSLAGVQDIKYQKKHHKYFTRFLYLQCLEDQMKSVHSIENDIEYGIFEKPHIIEYELSCINKAKLPWIRSETETNSSSSDSESTGSDWYDLDSINP